MPLQFAPCLWSQSILSHPLREPTSGWNVCQQPLEGLKPHWSWNALAIVFLPLEKGCNHVTYNKVIGNRLQPQSRAGKISSAHFQTGVRELGRQAAQLLNRRAGKQNHHGLFFCL